MSMPEMLLGCQQREIGEMLVIDGVEFIMFDQARSGCGKLQREKPPWGFQQQLEAFDEIH